MELNYCLIELDQLLAKADKQHGHRADKTWVEAREISSYRCSQLECKEESGETEGYSALYTPLLPLTIEFMKGRK